MAGTRLRIRDRKQCGSSACKRIWCVFAAAALLVLAFFLGLDRHTMTIGTIGSAVPIDFSSLAATVIPLDEIGANGNNPPVTVALGLSTASGMKSDFMQMTSVSSLVPKYAAKLQRHLESRLRNSGREPPILAASWRPSTP
jgi:hypothetical protein